MKKKELWRKKEYPLLTFQSTQEAMAAEKLFEQESIVCLIVPTPRELSEGCGLSLRIDGQSIPKAMEKINARRMNVAIFLWEKSQRTWKKWTLEESKGYLLTTQE
ncbi:DUF3343 domain-containing protein [Heliorestis convoluta]|nr:DUF3343 domain-containing protein [Heliorestis convoluta]